MGIKQRKLTIFTEILVFLAIINTVNILFFKENPGFIYSKLNPFWLVIILIAARYGFLAGLISSVIASVNLILYQTAWQIPTKVQLEKIIEIQNITLPIFFILIAIILGLIRQKQINEEEELKINLQQYDELLNKLNSDLKHEKLIRQDLEKRLVGSKDFFFIFSEIYRIEKLETKLEIKTELLNFLAATYKISKANILDITKNPPEIIASIGKYHNLTLNEKIKAELIKTKNFVILHNYDEMFSDDMPLVIFPIFNDTDELVEILQIEKMPFLKFTKINMQTMNLILKFINHKLNLNLNCSKE